MLASIFGLDPGVTDTVAQYGAQFTSLKFSRDDRTRGRSDRPRYRRPRRLRSRASKHCRVGEDGHAEQARRRNSCRPTRAAPTASPA
ncbi:hypothetical protein LP420_14095 [Massilia sp. B-10]|nr:hypothetical protein LP420_14095 [Massilia sp. B-10]